jgi:Icc-related predicted phosphoesterase
MKIWHISDSHTYHNLLDVPENVDMVIFSGDCSNPRNPYLNKPEVEGFLVWYESLPIPVKIFVAGNHDTSIEKNLITKLDFGSKGIIYLENDFTIVNGLKIWGSPITPTFGDWAFMKARHKTHDLWQQIPDDTDIVVVHGPPATMLDLSYNRKNELEFCGDSALRKRIIDINPKLCLFGHIHNCEDIINAGTRTLSIRGTIYSNGSVVTDGKFGKLSSNGNIFEI